MSREPTELEALVVELGITMCAEYGAPPNEEFRDSDGWTCTLRFGRRRMTVPFYCGLGHNGDEPTCADVLGCLVSDANTVELARSFEEWCSDLGYDSDSRRAEETHKACQETAKRLTRFLGAHLLDVACAEH